MSAIPTTELPRHPRAMTTPTQLNHNLFAALRAAFPTDLDATAIETETGALYSWRDLERATAMLANLLGSLEIPPGSRVAVHVEKSVEALLLYLATLRAGFVYLPLNTAYQEAELDYFIGNAEPAVVVCAGKKHQRHRRRPKQHDDERKHRDSDIKQAGQLL